jgi:hypothetical protein
MLSFGRWRVPNRFPRWRAWEPEKLMLELEFREIALIMKEIPIVHFI